MEETGLKPNAVLFKTVDGDSYQMQMFLLDEGKLVEMYSIPITDTNKVYDYVKDNQLCFSHVKITNGDKTVQVSEYDSDEMENYSYEILDLSSFSMFKKQDQTDSLSIEDIISNGEFESCINTLVEENQLFEKKEA